MCFSYTPVDKKSILKDQSDAEVRKSRLQGVASALLAVLLHGAAQKRHSWATEKDNCLPGGSCCQPFGEV